MGLSVWGSPNWFVSGTDLTGSRCGGGHREGTRCARCVCLCQGEAGTHTAHLGAHPHTQRSHAYIRSDPLTHTPSHMCPNTVAHTSSDTTPLTYSDRLLHTQMPSRLHTQCSHTPSNTHTPEHHHTHMLVCFTFTRGHFMHKHDHPRSSATTHTSICTRAHTPSDLHSGAPPITPLTLSRARGSSCTPSILTLTHSSTFTLRDTLSLAH